MKKSITLSSLFFASSLIAQEKPNVIIFLVDDMGLMDTSLPFMTDDNGNIIVESQNQFYHTPNMERLAERGVRFSTFYAPTVSSPSRNSILTGLHPARHTTTQWIRPDANNRGKYGPQDWNWKGITKETITLPSVMRNAGYRTIHVGKAHFGPIGSEGENPLNVGFDVNIGGSSAGQPESYLASDGYGVLKRNSHTAVRGLEKYHNTDTFLSEALTLEAMAQMEQSVEQQKPFFLYLAHYAAHTPFTHDKRFTEKYRKPGVSERLVAFASLIEGMDKSLGDIMDKAEELGVGENTIILFLGDNGSDAPLLNDQNIPTPSYPLRGKKGTVYEGGVRVPFIAGWVSPAKTKLQKDFPVKINHVQCQQGTVMDLFPTVLDVADITMPKEYQVDGISLRKQLDGKQQRKRKPRYMVHFPHDHNNSYFSTMRDGDWKLIYYYHPENPEKPSYELYNLQDDRGEKVNLAHSHPKQLKRMVKLLRSELIRHQALPPVDSKGNPIEVKLL